MPPWSPRFLLAHVNHLDYDSATVAEARGGQQFLGWDEARYMLAGISNAIRLQSYMFLLANRDPKKPKPEPPKPWPLPDKETKKERQAKPGSFAWIAGHKLAAIKRRKEGGGRR